jgi:hypothetical protein
MRSRFSSLSLFLGIALVLSSCARVPYGDQLPVTPDIPRDQESINEMPFVDLSDCPELNRDPPTTTVRYMNQEMGIAFTIPYNNQWGYAGTALPAYADHTSQDGSPGNVLFGPPTSGNLEGLGSSCDALLYYSLTFLPARTAQEAVRAIQSRGTEVVPNATVRTINGLTVVQYTDAGICSYPTLEVIGTKYNYNFTTSCGGDSEVDWQYLEDIVKSMELLK